MEACAAGGEHEQQEVVRGWHLQQGLVRLRRALRYWRVKAEAREGPEVNDGQDYCQVPPLRA